MLDVDMSAYLGVFLYEAEEQLQIMEEEVLKLEQHSGRLETIETIFRAAHTLKGSSAAMGFEHMSQLTHHMENIFDLLRRQKLSAQPELINLILECLDSLIKMKEDIPEGKDGSAPVQLLERLQQVEQTSGQNQALAAGVGAVEVAAAAAAAADIAADAVGGVGAVSAVSVSGAVRASSAPSAVSAVSAVDGAAYTDAFADEESDETAYGQLNDEQSNMLDQALLSLDEYQHAIIAKAIDSEYAAMAVFIRLSSAAVMKSARALLLHNNLKELGEIVAAFPPVHEIEDESLFNGNMVYVLATRSNRQEIIRVVNQTSEIDLVQLAVVNKEVLGEGYKAASPAMSPDLAASSVSVGDENPATSVNKTNQKVKTNQTVRVDVERLEKLMNLVGELVIDQTRLTEAKNRLTQLYEGNEELEMMNEIAAHLGRISSELQDGMMKTRMFPIDQLFNRFPRLIRDLAQRSGKQIDLMMYGNETELDRNLIEAISDPLIHLLRNSVDHGIEYAEERVKLGKPPKGKIMLKAEHEENHIVITVMDDGRGINTEKLKRSAVQKGLLDESTAARMGTKEALQLIFLPGFSTAKQITDISGRGVGMDIVKSHIEKLNGSIDIRTTEGEGTAFTIKLPLTLAINRSLLVRLGERVFAVPLSQVVEIIRLSPGEIKAVGKREVAVVRGRVLPLVRLHQRLELDEPTVSKYLDVVVMGLADKRAAIAVDKTLGNQEIVIKPLGKFLGNPPFIAGATIMGDGSVILILDVNAIIREEGLRETEGHAAAAEMSGSAEVEQLVTFQLGNEEYAANIHSVKDIIQVPAITPMIDTQPDVLGIIHLRGLLIPVIDLRKRLKYPPAVKTKQARIMIVDLGNRLAGILVDHVQQVLMAELGKINAMTEQAMHINTSFVKGIYHHGERIVTVLDLEQVLAMNEPIIMEECV